MQKVDEIIAVVKEIQEKKPEILSPVLELKDYEYKLVCKEQKDEIDNSSLELILGLTWENIQTLLSERLVPRKPKGPIDYEAVFKSYPELKWNGGKKCLHCSASRETMQAYMCDHCSYCRKCLKKVLTDEKAPKMKEGVLDLTKTKCDEDKCGSFLNFYWILAIFQQLPNGGKKYNMHLNWIEKNLTYFLYNKSCLDIA